MLDPATLTARRAVPAARSPTVVSRRGRRIGPPQAVHGRLAEAPHLGRADQQQQVAGPRRVARQAVDRAERDGHGGARCPGAPAAYRVTAAAPMECPMRPMRSGSTVGSDRRWRTAASRSSCSTSGAPGVPNVSQAGVGAVAGEVGQHDHVSARRQRVGEAAHQPGRGRPAVGHHHAGRPARARGPISIIGTPSTVTVRVRDPGLGAGPGRPRRRAPTTSGDDESRRPANRAHGRQASPTAPPSMPMPLPRRLADR